jgi:hypothetical protein
MSIRRFSVGARMSAALETGTYVDRTCVLRLEVNDGLTTAGNLDLVLRAETRHHCIVPPSVAHILVCLALGVASYL